MKHEVYKVRFEGEDPCDAVPIVESGRSIFGPENAAEAFVEKDIETDPDAEAFYLQEEVTPLVVETPDGDHVTVDVSVELSIRVSASRR